MGCQVKWGKLAESIRVNLAESSTWAMDGSGLFQTRARVCKGDLEQGGHDTTDWANMHQTNRCCLSLENANSDEARVTIDRD